VAVGVRVDARSSEERVVASDPQLLTDLGVSLRDARWRAVYGVDDERRVSSSGQTVIVDFRAVAGRDNLAQAIVMRLLTPRGELTPLGHPDYGSRLHELVGRQNTATTRNLAKLFILESLQAERRIASVLAVEVQAHAVIRERIDVQVLVQPAGASAPLAIGPLILELERAP
jgi:phage baseplate assembly protein W